MLAAIGMIIITSHFLGTGLSSSFFFFSFITLLSNAYRSNQMIFCYETHIFLIILKYSANSPIMGISDPYEWPHVCVLKHLSIYLFMSIAFLLQILEIKA